MNKGFTLIEVIIVICIFLVLLVIFWPVGTSFYRQELLSKTESQIIWALKQARTDAIDQKNNSSFGIYFQNQQIVLFQGSSFDQRVPNQDLAYNLPAAVAINGPQQIVFAANTGFTGLDSSINLSLGQFSRQIKINELGVFDY